MQFKITFISPACESEVLEFDSAALPSCGTGEPGSILDLALSRGIEIDHACGGVCACSTCHVKVRSGLSSCNKSSEEEENSFQKESVIQQ